MYLAFSVLGAVVPMAEFLPWVATHGLHAGLFIEEAFATRIAAFFSLDVLVSAGLLLLLVGRSARRGVRGVWLTGLGTLAVGVSLGLPLHLYFESRRAARR